MQKKSLFWYVTVMLITIGCEESAEEPISASSLSCRGIYYERTGGELKKYNQYEQGGRCLTENITLTRYEQSSENWVKKNVTCSSQPTFPSRTVIAANNYYDYRNSRAYLDFDSATGIYRRIILAESKTGQPVIARLQGCFYERAGQLLLDTDINKLKTTSYFDPMEIFSYVATATDLNMVRFDEIYDYSYTWCPTLNTPWKFCTALRSGNSMYFPILPAADMALLTNEAKVISVEYNWINTSKNTFDNIWDDSTLVEAIREDYKYDVIHIPDTPRFTSEAWRDYVMGNRPVMPDIGSSNSLNLCYQGSKTVTLSDGSTGKIFGEICYQNGSYSFVSQ